MTPRVFGAATLTLAILWVALGGGAPTGARGSSVAAPAPVPTERAATSAEAASGRLPASHPAPLPPADTSTPPAPAPLPPADTTSAPSPAPLPPADTSTPPSPAPLPPADTTTPPQPTGVASEPPIAAERDLSAVLPKLGPAGGATTITNGGVDSFSFPARNLRRTERGLFQVGSSFFNRNWVFAPASTVNRDGLGPFFNARSCSGCHFKDGRGEPPDGPDDPLGGMLIRWSVPTEEGGAAAVPHYGFQLQDHAAPTLKGEATPHLTWETVPFTYPDGTEVTLRRPKYTFTNLAYGPLPENLQVSGRVATTMAGLGLIEAIPAEDILAGADPDDADGDGISGRPNMVSVAGTTDLALGRLGWKAGQPSVKQQTAAAFLGDMGLTSTLFPNEDVMPGQSDAAALPTGGSPEVTDKILDRVTSYSSTLAVPAARPGKDGLFEQGRRLFHQVGCAKCHVETWKTGVSEVSKALSHQTIHPYTDLLLHDMGEGLADNRPEAQASEREWRTAPLWGLGLVDVVNAHTNFLHDGRAEDYEHAVLWHGGEAEASRNAFANLKQEEREALLAFLERL